MVWSVTLSASSEADESIRLYAFVCGYVLFVVAVKRVENTK